MTLFKELSSIYTGNSVPVYMAKQLIPSNAVPAFNNFSDALSSHRVTLKVISSVGLCG